MTRSTRSGLRPLHALSGRPPLEDFARFVDALPAPEKLLGLTHATTAYRLRELLSSGAIYPPENCPSLNERLTYAFYGRVAFRSGGDFGPTDLLSQCPSVLVLDPRASPRPKYVFAFDSGAFVNRMMDDYLGRHMPLFDFLLTPDAASAARLIAAVYPSNDDFLLNRSAKSLGAPASSFEIESYEKLLIAGGRGANRLDDRVTTPEFAFSDPIPLGSAVRAAIIPDTLAADPGIGGRLTEKGVEVIDYPWVSGTRPSENNVLLRSLAHDTYRRFGWL